MDILLGELAVDKGAVVGLAIADQVGNAVDQHGGFAAARAGQHQQGALGREHGLLLAAVHAGEVPLHHLLAQAAQFVFGNVHGFAAFLIFCGYYTVFPSERQARRVRTAKRLKVFDETFFKKFRP